MQAIWKETLNVTDEQTVNLPVNSKVLCVQEQGGHPCLWFTVPDVLNPNKETRTFLMYGTGHRHQSIDGVYIGTFQIMRDSLVFHVFEKLKTETAW